MIRMIINCKNEKKGNITILILIMGFAVILLTATMVGYMFHDVKFVEQDKEKLRALNIAEAGLSNMFLNIEKYYSEEAIPLPSSGYTREVLSNGVTAGNFLVEYDTTSNGDLTIYNVTSKGIDKNGVARTLSVKINVIDPQPILDIYDYVYAGSMTNFSGDFKPVDGPFYMDGDLDLNAGSGIVQEGVKGPVIVEGDLYMDGGTTALELQSLEVSGNVQVLAGAQIIGGQVNIAGNLTMDGGSYIDEGLVSPMIVMNELNMVSGSPRIGEYGKEDELILSVHSGVVNLSGDPHIYATRDDSLTYTFNDPGFDVNTMVTDYYNEIKDTALTIPGSLTLDDLHLYDNSDANGNKLSFQKEGEKYILEINGNVIIDGNLQIGMENWWISSLGGPSTNEVYYRGKGVIYTTGSIKTVTTLRPDPLEDYPEVNLLVFVSNTNIESYVWRGYDDVLQSNISTYPPFIYMVAVAKNNIKIAEGGGKGAIVMGTVIAGGELDAIRYNARVWYKEGIKESLPPDMPGPSGGGEVTITRGEWQELINQ